jgi:hypothetical protein
VSADEGRSGGRPSLWKTLAERILVPLAAAAASAAAGYVARNAPRLIEEKLLPTLAGANRAPRPSSPARNGDSASAPPDELEHARAERAARRDERKQAASRQGEG